MDDERLDAAINETARQITAVEPPLDFRRRVMARISDDSAFRVAGSGFRSWRPALAGLSVAALILAAMIVSRHRDVPENRVGLSTSRTTAPASELGLKQKGAAEVRL